MMFFQIVESLLENGAHIDVRNMRNERPLDMLKKVTDCKINPLMYLSLRCLAASTIARNKLPYKKEMESLATRNSNAYFQRSMQCWYCKESA